jgi:hypothetical protein
MNAVAGERRLFDATEDLLSSVDHDVQSSAEAHRVVS